MSAVTTITIFHDPALSDQTVLEEMRPDGIPQFENPNNFSTAFKNQFAVKMQKFFASISGGSQNAVVYSFIMNPAEVPQVEMTANNAAIAPNDTVSIGSIVFTAVALANQPGEFTIGATSQDTADNLLEAIRSGIGAGVFGGAIAANSGDLPASISLTGLMGPVTSLITVSTSNTSGFIWSAGNFSSPSNSEFGTVSNTIVNNYGLALGGGGGGGGGGGDFLGGLTPLAWDGDDYTGEGIGPGPMVLFLCNSDTPEGAFQWVDADNQPLNGIPGVAGAMNDFDMGMIGASAGEVATLLTVFVDHSLWAAYSLTPSFANATDLLLALNIPVTNVFNWKFNALTQNGDAADYTWETFADFEQAGTVEVVTGFTTPPYIDFNTSGNHGLAPGELGGTYSATMSPLSWDGDDYDSPNFGDVTPGCYFMVYTGGPGGITHVDSDGVDITGLPVTDEGLPNFHVCLMKFGGANPTTCYVDKRWFINTSNDEDAAGATNLFVNTFMLATATCENFKQNGWTGFVTGLDYTWNGYTGFSEAGAVALVTGSTSPQTLVWKP